LAILPEQLRQFGDVDGDAPGFVTGQELGGRRPTRIVLAIDEGERLPIVIAR
jgi:hypothetical protein